MTPVKVISRTTAGLVFLLAIGSFALSYNALQDVAIQNGITGPLSYVWPLLIDASLIVFSLAVVNAYLQSESTWRQWALVGVYTVATIGFNVLHAPDSLQAQVVAAIAPVSLFFSFELLMNQLKTSVQKHGLQQNVTRLLQEVDNKRQELDTITAQVEKQQGKLKQLKQVETVSYSGENDSMLHARQARSEQATNEKEQRLLQMVDILKREPETPVTELAETLDVSRTTVYRDIDTLVGTNRLRKADNGLQVVTPSVNGKGA